MKVFARPGFWLPLTLLILTGLGGRLLWYDACVHLSERDRESYGARPLWQANFDALSATCGVGLLTYDLKEDYTTLGRWVLAGLGVAGAILYLAAARQAVGRLWTAHGPAEQRPESTRLPSTRLILAAFLVLQAMVIGLAWLAELAAGSASGFSDSAWNAIAAFSSLGWLRDPSHQGHAWIYAVVAWIGALGWMVWLIVIPGVWQHRARMSVLVALGTYVMFLLVAAGVVAALEVPRGKPHAAADERLASLPPGQRYARSLVQVTCAAGAGIPTEELGDRAVSDGTKVVLAGTMLVGGLGGNAGGGAKWVVVLASLAAGAAAFGRGSGRSRDETRRRCALATVICAGSLVVLTVVVALGLLVIESRTAPSYQLPPTFADALLDAGSAAGGGGLTSGLAAAVTSPNLSRGIRQNVDLYQYGMVWLMAAMFVGRVLPIAVLGRFVGLRFDDAPARLPPVV